MKNKIIEIGKKHGLELTVESNRIAFDIIDYDVWFNNKIVNIYRHYTGKTNTGIVYPTPTFLSNLENDLKVFSNAL